MANYYGQARTNYFQVKDLKAWRKELGDYPVELIETKDDAGTIRVGFMDANQDGGGLDWSWWDFETDDDVEIDWTDILARHLADNEVAILMEVGSEKYRYLTGWAMAVNNKKETREISLSKDIMAVAQELGDNVTGATY
jgi:hypothetical protein